MGIEAIIALIGPAISLVNNITSWIHSTVATAKQTAELTPEQEAALDAEIAKLKLNPEEYDKVQPL